jgi:hypothetical protein
MVDFTSEGLASIWVGQKRHGPEIDLLRDLCGVDYYAVDFQECVIGEGGRAAPVATLLRRLPYSRSFLDEALRAAAERKIADALWALLQLDSERTLG